MMVKKKESDINRNWRFDTGMSEPEEVLHDMIMWPVAIHISRNIIELGEEMKHFIVSVGIEPKNEESDTVFLLVNLSEGEVQA
jgi:hypothetical protein